ncbi:pyridoxal phosphate-dependent transferase [Xylariaceae sp. FL0255]|nr:pyridoxal phosphate-dependent transferase [Xylariaceae sp. FL0255]
MDDSFLENAYHRIRATAKVQAGSHAPTLPGPTKLCHARASLPVDNNSSAFTTGIGPEATLNHLLTDIVPALNGQNRSGRYWGFVTGSVLPIAEVADNIVSAYDQNVQVHLPDQTIATEVEDSALRMLISVLDLGTPDDWEGRTFTTGATGSNILGLACGRESVIAARLPTEEKLKAVGELGLLKASAKAGVSEIQVLTSMGHSSLSKAAGIVGLGRDAVKLLPFSDAEPWRLDIDAVERELARSALGVASIVAISAGEVNTGRFATTGLADMKRLRDLADRYGAWIHVDGAFGMFARVLPHKDAYLSLHKANEGLELADSITLDGHKLLNVPYDNGIFFTRKSSTLNAVCQNPNAAYLSSDSGSKIQSPLNIGLENSRRFRALPVYAVLKSEGKQGLSLMMERTVQTARAVARAIREAEDDYVLLPSPSSSRSESGGPGSTDEEDNIHIVVLFRAKDNGLNETLVKRINEGNKWYVSGSKWNGKPAVRVAVSSWRADRDDAYDTVKTSLATIAENYKRLLHQCRAVPS